MLKCGKFLSPMKLTGKLSTKYFILSQVLIFIVSLAFLGVLYYILNIQYQQPKKPFTLGPVTTLPKSLRLDLDQPEQDSLSYASSIIVSGKTASSTEILLSTQTSDWVIKSKPDGYFSTVVDLVEGVNIISATVFDWTGDFRSAERTVYYSKEKL